MLFNSNRWVEYMAIDLGNDFRICQRARGIGAERG